MAEPRRPEVFSSKLRNSCDACATAKVGCTKEKPICTRCENRKIECVYSATKRAGRVSTNKQRLLQNNSTSSTAQSSPAATPTHMTGSSTPSKKMHTHTGSRIAPPSPDPSQSSFAQFSPICPETFGALFPNDPSSIDFADFLASPTALSGDGNFDFTSFTEPLIDWNDFGLDKPNDNGNDDMIFSTVEHQATQDITADKNWGNGGGKNPLFPSLIQEVATRTAESSPLPRHDSRLDLETLKAPDPLLVESDGPSKSSDHCLSRALACFVRLSAGAPSACAPNVKDLSLHRVERMIAQNQEITEIVNQMLECGHSHDAYLLAVLSLIISMITAWYRVAGHAISNLDRKNSATDRGNWQNLNDQRQASTRSSSQDSSDGEDQQRLAFQSLLSKLVGLQRSVNMLLQRLQSLDDKQLAAEDPTISVAAGRAPLAAMSEADLFALPVGANAARMLAADMRKQLGVLSQTLVERLQS